MGSTPRRKKKRYDVEGSDREDEGDALLGGLIDGEGVVSPPLDLMVEAKQNGC